MMHGARLMLEPIALPRSAGAGLDELLASRFLPKLWARRIWSAQELPTRLQRRVAQLTPDSEWRAYSDEDRIFFAIARIHVPAVARDSSAALDVYFLDRDAVVYSAGVWVHDLKQGWWLDAVLDASYDCEHGWWFESLTDPRTAIDSDLTPSSVPQLASGPVLSTVGGTLCAPNARR